MSLGLLFKAVRPPELRPWRDTLMAGEICVFKCGNQVSVIKDHKHTLKPKHFYAHKDAHTQRSITTNTSTPIT